ncbi:MAG: hypothetical protein WAV38_39625 [Xanthobacteraceae bacterium]
MPGENENRRNLSHHGNKAASGFATRSLHDLNSVAGPDMPCGGVCGSPINADPHQGGPKANVYMPRDRTPLRGDPQQMRPPHTASPHRAAADPGPRESVVITPRSKP